MKWIVFTFLLMISPFENLFPQDFDFEIIYPCDSVKYGFGIEAGIRLFRSSGNKGTRFLVKSQDPIRWEIHPDTLFEPGYSTLSVRSDDIYYTGVATLEITGIQQEDSVKKSLKIKIFGENIQQSFTREKTCLNQSAAYLKTLYPEFRDPLNEIDTSSMFCYRPFPAFDIVNHNVLLSGHWRIHVQEHVMVPPYNWKKIFFRNDHDNLYFGVEINTYGVCSLIPCQLNYYFQRINFTPLDIRISNSSIPEDNELHELIGILSAMDDFDTLSYQYRIVNGEVPFIISNGNELRANAVFSYERDSILCLDILSENETGYASVRPFVISVLQKSTPSGISESISEPGKFCIHDGKILFADWHDKIEVYDLSGRMIRSKSNTCSINLEGLKRNILLIRLLDSNTASSLKVLF